MRLKRVDWYPDCVRIVTAQEHGTTHMDQSLTHRDAARLLAGLEVALAAALREAGSGRCLKCGRTASTVATTGLDYLEQVMCGWCGGVLAPVEAGRQPATPTPGEGR